ncbi:hypothetical protein FIBSPDRAFT_924892 [Athelia psychrophila]|uniref:DUF1640-domain-containing protein n=1 Tax=Athelia psychrophila TaxID=1759441 RepID=A0A166VMK2_9AGAM|nr:hypothetical protein FIBSPDRAFT_924892 [Fibularhizoctonia sp. CBS 109695]
MLLRQLPRISRSLTNSEARVVLPSSSAVAINPRISYRHAHTSSTISDPDPPPEELKASGHIPLVHPRDSRWGQNDGEPASSDRPGSPPPQENGNSLEPSRQIVTAGPSREGSPVYASPPFNTHQFFKVLERVFPPEVARSLMRATRALLVDRLGRIRREGLTAKDLDNHMYLFRAALSELRAEVTMRTRNDFAAIRTATTALRRDVDRVDIKMKEDISTLKHEIQMDLHSRKNEANTDIRQSDIMIEELMNKTTIQMGDLRTEMESVKWDNMRKSVGALSAFLLVILLTMEIRPSAKPHPSPKSNYPPPEAEGPEKTTWVV